MVYFARTAARVALLVTPLVLLAAAHSARPNSAAAQAFDGTTFVRELHARYIGREPSAEEAAYWVQKLQQGTTPGEVHAGIVGSEAYFDRSNRNVATWLNGAFNALLRRPPAQNEVAYWTARLQQLNNNRIQLANELLRFSGNGLPSPVASPQIYVTAEDAPGRIVSTAQLLSQSVDSELPGTADWLVKVQASSLLAAARNARPALTQPARDPDGAAAAYLSLIDAIRGIQEGLAHSTSPAPLSRLYASQLQSLIQALPEKFRQSESPFVLPQVPATQSGLAPVFGGAPSLSPISASGLNRDALDRQTLVTVAPLLSDVARDSQQTVFVLRSTAVGDYLTNQMLGDVEAFTTQVDSLRGRFGVGITRTEFRSLLTLLRRQAAAISDEMRRAKPDARVVQSWYEATLTFNQVLDVAGLLDGAPVEAVRTASYRDSPTARAADAAGAVSAQCDALITAYTPLAFYASEVPALQSELRVLRNQIETFRQSLQRAAPSNESRRYYALIEEQLRRVKRRWDDAVLSLNMRNLPDLGGIATTMERLDAIYFNATD